MNPVIPPPGMLWLHFAYKEWVPVYFSYRAGGRVPAFPDEPWMGYSWADAVCVLMCALSNGAIRSCYVSDDGIVEIKPGCWQRDGWFNFIETGKLKDKKFSKDERNIFVEAVDFNLALGELRNSSVERIMNFSAPVVHYIDQNQPEKEDVKLTLRARGPQPKQRERVIAAMRKWDADELAGLTEEAMKSLFDAGRDTCRKARAVVLLEKAAANSDK